MSFVGVQIQVGHLEVNFCVTTAVYESQCKERCRSFARYVDMEHLQMMQRMNAMYMKVIIEVDADDVDDVGDTSDVDDEKLMQMMQMVKVCESGVDD